MRGGCGAALALLGALAGAAAAFPPAAARVGGLALGATVMDLGDVPAEGLALGEVRVWNPGPSALTLRSRPSCGCTSIGSGPLRVAPSTPSKLGK